MHEDLIIERLKKLRIKVNDMFLYREEHIAKDSRFLELQTKLAKADSKQALYDYDREYSEFCNEVGIGPKAEKLQKKLEKEYGDLLSTEYFTPKHLSLIIEALENGEAKTLEQAIEIAVNEVSKSSIDDLIERILADRILK